MRKVGECQRSRNYRHFPARKRGDGGLETKRPPAPEISTTYVTIIRNFNTCMQRIACNRPGQSREIADFSSVYRPTKKIPTLQPRGEI